MMSYCRWSSDYGECDVYVYEHVDGSWTTHVAGRRLKHKAPDEIKNMPCDTGEEFMAQHEALKAWRDKLPCDEVPCKHTDGKKDWDGVMRLVKDSEYTPLDEISKFAGETFKDQTPNDCAARLETIRASGLNVPQYAIDRLKEET